MDCRVARMAIACAAAAGPRGSGKSHLGHIWASHAAARQITAIRNPGLEKGNLLLEDIDQIRDERALLHLLNFTKENSKSLLLTSSLPAEQLPFTLPDLTSRLRALPVASLGQPDDEALAFAMRKQFADRQVKVDEEVIAYLLPRMERSFAQVRELVEQRLDQVALAEKKNLTIPFVKRLLEKAT